MTAPRFLLDTNVIIGLAQGPGAARDLLDASGATPAESAISQITRIELLSFPLLSVNEEVQLRQFIGPFAVFMLSEPVERATIDLRRSRRMKLPDAIIAATAEVHGLTLLTLDERLRSALGP
jgi:predicted nucleic acid-binding protein